MPKASTLWRMVDWFAPRALLPESEGLRRTRLLVVCVLGLIPLSIIGTVELWRAGTLVAEQATMMGFSSVALIGCLVLLRFSRLHAPAGTLFCLYLIWAVFFLSATDLGLRDPILAWAALIPIVAAFVVGPRLATICAGLLGSGVALLYVLEESGYYVPPMLSTPGQINWFTLLSLLTVILFAAFLGWLYEGHTIRRLRRLNAEMRDLRAELEVSEERYRSLFENIPVGVYQSTPNGQITMANGPLLKMLGATSVESLRNIDAFSLYENPLERTKLLNRLDLEGEVQGAEFVLQPRPSQKVWVRESARVARDADGRTLFYEGIIEDVTGQRRAEAAARSSEERHRALVQHSTDTITILDTEGTVLYQSPSFTSNLGFEQGATIGTSVLDLIHPEDRRRAEILFRRAATRTGEFGTVEFRCRHADGHYVYVEAVGSNMSDNPWIRGIVLNSRDITERKRAEVALVQAKDQAEEVARLKGAFLANMSHEIRTPLTGIIGFADVLAEEVEDEHREFVQLIARSGRRLLQTLNSVLDLARLEANQMEVDLEPVDVAVQVKDAVMLLQPLARDKQLQLTVEASPGNMRARLDVACFSRILNNLVGNALKFTDDGAIRVLVKPDGDYIQVSISDTGVGIDQNFLPQLFDEFKQESSGLRRQHEGSGLGLTITRRLVELMHGQIHVLSEKGKGSTFTVRFPADVSTGHSPLLATAVKTLPRVLVVDDNESTLALMVRMLRDIGLVDTALTPEEALQLAKSSASDPYDIVFLDIHLSVALTGTDVLRQLRAIPEYAQVRVVAFTAFALPGDRERFLNSGFSGYLGKPFTREKLLKVFREMLDEEAKWGEDALMLDVPGIWGPRPVILSS